MPVSYQEFEATPTPTGGHDGGRIHRLYSVAPRGKEHFDLLQQGWKPADLTSGRYANTSLLKAAIAISNSGANLVYVR